MPDQASGGRKPPGSLNLTSETNRRCRWPSYLVRIFLMCLMCGMGTMTVTGCRRVPQVLTDEAVFGELDALYTAVTSKRPELLSDCRKRLTQLHKDKKLSDAGFAEVETIMDMSEDNEWANAAQRLYDFMRAQRKVAKD